MLPDHDEPLFVEVTRWAGEVEVWPMSVYLQMPAVALAVTRERLLSRTEVIARRAREARGEK
jgi:hypothetical protein